MTLSRWDDNLFGVPRRIAELDHSPIRVLAGPGTGKTFSLMRRVARLLSDSANPNKIKVCTFTRTAAYDLQMELSRLGIDSSRRVSAGTLHSFCFNLLSKNEVLLLTGRVPRPLLLFEERFLLEDLHFDGFGGIRDCSKRLRAFNAAWARLQSEDPGWPSEPTDQLFHQSLMNWLIFHEAILIGELIPVTLHYLWNNPASPYRREFDHVLVDEYQDLNRAEQVLLDVISESGTLIVIGDEDQSIYSFKYAHPGGISNFNQTHPGTHDEGLDECRRCPIQVVEMANALIRNNTNRASRILRPLSTNPNGEVFIVQWRSIEKEAQGIAEFIRARITSGQIEPGEVLVLAPRRHFGYAIRNALNNLGVNAHSFFHEEALEGNSKNLNESEVQQAFTLLTLIANPNDRVALRCWCGFGSSSLCSRTWNRLREQCELSGNSPLLALENLVSGSLSIPYSTKLITRFQELKQRINELRNLRGEDLVNALFPEGHEWTDLIRNLASSINGDNFNAQTLLETLRIGITQPELPTDVDYVRVMSLHKSKGLTAQLVVVVGCIEGLIPIITGNSISDRNLSLQEQRRLFYVAITRTRNILLLSSVTQLPRNLAHRMGANVSIGNRTHVRTIASRFLSELGPTRPNPVLGSSII